MKVMEQFLQEARTFEKKNSVKVIIRNSENKILILRRRNEDAGGGNWDIPGGAIESGEDQRDAVHRETFEETGLKLRSLKKLTKIALKIPESGVDSDMHIYLARTDDRSVNLKPANWKGADGTPEHSEYAWIRYKIDLKNRPMLSILKSVVMKRLKRSL